MDQADNLPEAVKAAFKARDAVLQAREKRTAEMTSMDRKRFQKRSLQQWRVNSQLIERYKELLEEGGRCPPQSQSSPSSRINELRRLVILDGIPTASYGIATSRKDEDHPDVDVMQHCSLRGMVWKILLGVVHIDAGIYIKLVEQGTSCEDSVIKQDTCRTFKGDEKFQRRVPEEKLSRVNNAFVWLTLTEQHQDQMSEEEWKNGMQGWNTKQGRKYASEAVSNIDDGRGAMAEGKRGNYVQGMTILSGPLLFEMPEVDAFYTFYALLTHHMPRYITRNLDGVHAGCGLVDRILLLVDPPLAAHLHDHTLTASIYAFPFIMSLHACIPPLTEVLKLWDVLFAFGVHLEVFLVVAQCVLLRGTLLPDSKPYHHLNPRNFHSLDADVLVSAAFSLMTFVPQDMLEEVVRHPLISEQKAKNLSGSKTTMTEELKLSCG